MGTTLVRVTEETKSALKQLSAESGEPMPMILAKAVEAYQRALFLQKAAESVERLHADPVAWADYLEERRQWEEGTDRDGLEDEEPYTR